MINMKASPFDDPGAAWEPYRPTPEAPWDAARVAHMHRRAGFGATWAQVRRDVAEGFEPSLRRLLDGEDRCPDGRSTADFDETVGAMRDSFLRNPSMGRVSLLWLFRMIGSPHPLAEVMTLAWHSHYASSQAKVSSPEAMLDQNLVFRKHWRSPISAQHKAILADAAMLRWLDGMGSVKANPNENLGREFLELFALGVGNYTERDVRETARAFTGWRQSNYTPLRVVFDPSDHDDDPKTILGEAGDWAQDDVVRIVCRQPAAAEHLARRLYRTFVCDVEEPSPELIVPLAAAMRTEGDVDVARGIEVILRSRLFHGEACRSKRVKSPAALAIGAARSCEAFGPPPRLDELEIHLTKMAQRLFFPPSVAGWRGGLSWLDNSTILARANFAAWFTGGEAGLARDHFEKLAERVDEAELATLLVPTPVDPSGEADPAMVVRRLLSMPEGQLC